MRLSRLCRFVLIVLGLMLTGCNLPSGGGPSPAVSAPGSDSPEVPTPLPPPTPTEIPADVLLVTSPQTDRALAKLYQDTVKELANQSSLKYEAIDAADATALVPLAKIVVVLPPDPGLAKWIADSPAVQYAAIGIPNLQPAPNLTSIGNTDSGALYQGLLGGYIAAMMSPGWRMGIITLGKDENRAVAEAFVKGTQFYCGICRDSYPPFDYFPESAEIDNPSDAAAWQAALQTLQNKYVKTLYVNAPIDPAAVPLLAEADLDLIGAQAPPAELRSHWITTIAIDPLQTFKDCWDDLVAGKSSGHIEAPIALEDANETMLTPGRRQFLIDFIRNLSSGQIYIETGS